MDWAALRIWVGFIIEATSFAALGALLMQVFQKEDVYVSNWLSKELDKVPKVYFNTFHKAGIESS